VRIDMRESVRSYCEGAVRARSGDPTLWLAGHVWFPKHAHWLGELERELLAFPNSGHDDQVDALSYAAVLAGRPEKVWSSG